METTDGTLLDGRVRYAQPRDGFRTGIEPVLLAACVPARPGDAVLEAGTGAGAGLLCLGHRVAGLSGTGIERDPAMAALARQNLAANGLDYTIVTADIAADLALLAADHVFANPPWHDPASTRPSEPRRAAAKQRDRGGLAVWIGALSAAMRPGGTLTLALPASLGGEAMALLHRAGLGRLVLMPLWPRAGQQAKLVLVQAARGPGPSRIAAGLVLHGEGPGYTAAATAILRGGEALPLG